MRKSYTAHPVRWWIVGFGTAAFGIWAVVGVPTWIQGRWGQDLPVMRYLFQCSGTTVDEQARWEPKRLLVSACRQPFVVDTSPSGRIATVKIEQPEPQTLVLDAESRSIILTLDEPRGVLAISDNLLYYTIGNNDHRLYDLALNQEYPIIEIPSESEDISLLEEARTEAQDDFEYYEGNVQLFVFNTPSGRRAIDISGVAYPTYLELFDTWHLEARVVVATRAMPNNSHFHWKPRSCVLGNINPDMAGPGLLEQMFAGVCWFEYTNPVLVDP